MKKIIAVIFLTFCFSVTHAATYNAVPINGDDIAEILDLSVSKYQINFDTPKHVIVRYESSDGHKQDFEIKEKTKSLTIRFYLPKESPDVEPYKRIHFKVTTDNGGGVTSKGSYDSSKVESTRVGLVDDVFTFAGYPDTKSNSPFTFRFQVLTNK